MNKLVYVLRCADCGRPFNEWIFAKWADTYYRLTCPHCRTSCHYMLRSGGHHLEGHQPTDDLITIHKTLIRFNAMENVTCDV